MNKVSLKIIDMQLFQKLILTIIHKYLTNSNRKISQRKIKNIYKFKYKLTLKNKSKMRNRKKIENPIPKPKKD